MEILLASGAQGQETCPRVLAHEIGHTLGLCHARVGLLSRMQGAVPPGDAFVNDFSPIMTYYDVLALQRLYDRRNPSGATLGQLLARGGLLRDEATRVAGTADRPVEPTFSPAAPLPITSVWTQVSGRGVSPPAGLVTVKAPLRMPNLLLHPIWYLSGQKAAPSAIGTTGTG